MRETPFALALAAAPASLSGASGSLIFLVLTILVAVTFDFTNGFHDTANAVATSISTRVLSPRLAIVLAACLNCLGALISTNVAKTIGTDVVSPAALTQLTVMAGLLAAIGWNLVTWYAGLPSSSSHALIGGLIGGAIIVSPLHFGALKGGGILVIALSLVLSPVVGLGVAFVVGTVLVWLFRWRSPHEVTRVSTWLQRVSAGFVAFSHGSNDAQKTMGVITAALLAYQGTAVGAKFQVPVWVILPFWGQRAPVFRHGDEWPPVPCRFLAPAQEELSVRPMQRGLSGRPTVQSAGAPPSGANAARWGIRSLRSPRLEPWGACHSAPRRWAWVRASAAGASFARWACVW